MKTIIFFIFILGLSFFSQAQVKKIETWQVGTKVVFYADSCTADMPEAEGKISFCDNAGNLGIVEKSYGLNARGVQSMVYNFYNDDEAFKTSSGVSIRKTDGTWDNFPAFTAPRSTLTSNGASVSEAIIAPSGHLLFTHGNMWGLHRLNLETKNFSVLDISYPNSSGNLLETYSVAFTFNEQNGITYIIGRRGTSWHLFAYDTNGQVFHLGNLPSFTGNVASYSNFQVRDGYAYMGSGSGMYRYNISTGSWTLFNSSNILPFNRVSRMQFDSEGYLWIANNSNNDGAICRIDLDDMSVDAFYFATSNPNINYRFNDIAIDNDHNIFALAANGDGFFQLNIENDSLVGELFHRQFFANLGFPMTYNPNGISWYKDKIYFTTVDFSTSVSTNYEVIILDGESWSGINDDEPGNISSYHARRYHRSYPVEGGMWWHNQYDGGVISFFDNEGNFKKHYNTGGTNSFILDSDNVPVLQGSGPPRKVDIPLIYSMQATDNNNFVRIRRYKDQVWAFNREARKLVAYRNNNIVGEYPLDLTVYSQTYDFNMDTEGNAWFFRVENNDVVARKFDPLTLTTTEYQTGVGTIGWVRSLFPMPDGKMVFFGGNAVIVYDGQGNFTRYDNSHHSAMTNIVTGFSDVNGKLYIVSHDQVRVVTIENPLSDEPEFNLIRLEGNAGIMPYVGFYRAGGVMLDMEGNLWGHGRSRWAKIELEDAAPPFLNHGETFGIVGRVYLDLNNNEQYDTGEEAANVRVSLVANDLKVDTYTDSLGYYFFNFLDEVTEYTLTITLLPTLSISSQPQQLFTVSNFDENYHVDDFVLNVLDIESLLVKSTQRTGLWGFQRAGWENRFTTAIGNLSTQKTFENLEVQYVFMNSPGSPDVPLPDIEDIIVWELSPVGLWHVIASTYITPLNNKWAVGYMHPSTYTQTQITVETSTSSESGATYAILTIPEVKPMHTYLFEIMTDMFPPEYNNEKVKYGVYSLKSEDFDLNVWDGYEENQVHIHPEDMDPNVEDPSEILIFWDPEESVPDSIPDIDEVQIYAPPLEESIIFSSYDPNDKLVSPGLPDQINLTDINKKWLTYTVRFQNEGNFPAKDVYIIDEIDPNLDLNTISVVEYTHPMQLSQIAMNDATVLRFSFDDIYLDYSDNDEEASQGHVKFMIKAHDTIVPGTLVQNSAAIYFDQNPPIFTNTVMNQFVELYNLGLKALPSSGGIVNINAGGKYQEGEQILLRAHPNEEDEYYFVNWTSNGVVVSDSLEFTFTMPGTNATLLANFRKDSPEIYTLDILIEPAEGGQVIAKVDNEVQQEPYSFEEGTEVVLEAVAEDSYTFIGWQRGDQSFTDNPITFTMESSFSVTANFDFESSITEDILSGEPNIFPNPASQNITLQSPFLIKYLEIYDARGVLVFAQEINSDFADISISDLRSGIYFLSIFTDDGFYTQKLQVIR
ncbi:MAG: T9SS C-terminal target domain-containing protein [Bacteroidetes bacterium]|nr:MAG: T9SS C-terminal target domain-containing protein [Bacteroidota bacterium]